MLKRVLVLVFISIFGFHAFTKADEGMWLPLLLKKLNEADMQKAGLKLTADDIYNINHSSMKDAIVRLGGGFCTGEMISGEGLMLTNHHCGFESIQEHSSVEHDYLTDGFWAKSNEQELPNPGLTVAFLIRIEDLTARFNSEISDTLSESQRGQAIQKLSAVLIKEAADSNGYTSEVKSCLKGNEFYLFVYQVFKDVRLVGAPPSSIGKFGGDTDNWMWPRHTGDFSLFRVYMSKDSKPAEYNKDNIPYKPKYFLPISLEGVKQDDFTMVMGYPGTTDRYLTSEGVKLALEQSNPSTVKIRAKKLAIIKQDMDADPAIRIKYSSKYYQTSNYYKYFIGQSKGLSRMQVAENKQQDENKFKLWANKDPNRKLKYGNTLPDMEKNYAEIRNYNLSRVYFNEAVIQGAEIILKAYQFKPLFELLSQAEPNPIEIKTKTKALEESGIDYFKNYNSPTDQKLLASLLELYYQNVPPNQLPECFNDIKLKYKSDFNAFAQSVFSKTIFADSASYYSFLANPTEKKLKKDPAFIFVTALFDNYTSKVSPFLRAAELQNAKSYRYLVSGLREMNPEQKFYPDANHTMRLTYGKVADYIPEDAVHYDYYTTFEGILEKKDTANSDFKVPPMLEKLFKKKDFGRFGVNGKLPVCFITNNDITGGNSGSPVINGKGELIGLAFDGNWEAMSGEIAYDPVYKRCINVDIRYILFIIDKFAGASNLIQELKLN